MADPNPAVILDNNPTMNPTRSGTLFYGKQNHEQVWPETIPFGF
jgi:hypothetical protein